jgi:hypothetical protein
LDTIFLHVPHVLKNVKEALLETLTLGAHVTDGGVCGLAERLQLRLKF